MAAKPSGFYPRRLNVWQQSARMKLLHPGFDCRVRGNTLICRGYVQPTLLNARYRVRLEYQEGGTPEVWVEEPRLRRRDPDEMIPHTYDDDQPCLYRPRRQEWSSEKLIATTILPWLSLWLWYYESWLVTGEWQGGGEHPPREGDDGRNYESMKEGEPHA